MSKPVAVLISDVHFSVPTLELASAALKMALDTARTLHVPLVIAGDLLDGKALIRGECANRIIELLSNTSTQVYISIGNHDLLSEKGKGHSLKFLAPYAMVIDSPVFEPSIGSWIVPYFNDKDALQSWLWQGPKAGDRLIMHQGVLGAEMGHYVQDVTSLPPEAFADFRVVSGHYHKAQDIKTGRPQRGAVGLFSYIGSPYTTSAAEAHDGPKGFQVLHSDGLLNQMQTGLRKHVTVEREWVKVAQAIPGLQPKDLLWLKVTGPHSELEKLDKREIGKALLGHSNFKLDKVPTDAGNTSADVAENNTKEQVLDLLIEGSGESETQKAFLKKLWREVMT